MRKVNVTNSTPSLLPLPYLGATAVFISAIGSYSWISLWAGFRGRGGTTFPNDLSCCSFTSGRGLVCHAGFTYSYNPCEPHTYERHGNGAIT